jgi:hypothetical protein
MANQNPTINIRNLNYIQNAKKGDLKPCLVAEALQDVQTAYGAIAAQQNSTQAALTAALARIAKLEQS